MDPHKIKMLARRLVSWPSETGGAGEAAFAERFRALLLETPYFQAHPDHIRLTPSHGAPMASNLFALVKGAGARTLMLAGHYDTVSTDNYRTLQPLALDCEGLSAALVSELSARERTDQEELALQDLRSGAFIPGRGMLDMKSALAAAVGCLAHFAARPDRAGNLLLAIMPDEEQESRGARTSRAALKTLAKEWEIDVAAAINMDVTSDLGDGRDGRAVYAGSIGKLQPFALIAGCGSHAGYPFEGVSAQALAAGALARIEAAAHLADRSEADVSPPPICLEGKDLRTSYEVTTPERYWLAFNWLYHACSAKELSEQFQQEVVAGAAEAARRFAEQAAVYGALSGQTIRPPESALRALSFSELKGRAEQRAGEDFTALYAAQQEEADADGNPLAASRRIVSWLADLAGLRGPAIVTGFAGLHYPPCRLQNTQRADRDLIHAIDAARREFERRNGPSLTWKPYFQGISDMSFLGQTADGSEFVASETPVERLVDHPPSDALTFPIVNIGPWGRELHQRLERVHAPYAFDTLPRLISLIAENFLTRASSN